MTTLHILDNAVGLPTFRIDPALTSVAFAVRHMMITTVTGRFTDVSGLIHPDTGFPSRSSVEVIIGAASIDTGVPERDDHLRSPDFLDAERYPEITFASTRLDGTRNRFLLTGDLTIRGIARPVTLDATFEGLVTDPSGVQHIGFAATGAFDRREYGLVWNRAMEAGGVLVGEEVRLTIAVAAVRER